MDYGEIINSAFRLSWRNKSLWIFGLFAFGMSFPQMNWKDHFNFHEPVTLGGYDWGELAPILLGLAGLIVLLMVVVHLVANAISTPALVDAVNRITRGGEYRFKTSFRTGVHYMWRTLALMILAFFTIVLVLGVLAGIGVVAFVMSWIIGVLSLLFLIPILLIVIFVVTTIFNLAFRSIVVRDWTVAEGLSEGIELLKRHTWPCIVMALIYVGLAIVVGIAATIIGLLIVAPFLAIATLSDVGLITSLLIGIPLFWLVMLPISGFLGTVFEAMYTIFYFRLFEPAAENLPGQPNAAM